MAGESPLGRQADYPEEYAPDVLFPIARADQRGKLGIAAELPFHGVDIWNAWELTWLKPNGQPDTAMAEIRVPADSENIVESKSLKLYLGSFAMSRYATGIELDETITADLSAVTKSVVEVKLRSTRKTDGKRTKRMPGECLDSADVDCDVYDVEPSLLQTHDDVVREDLYSDLLRSLCPVTGQPDFGSVMFSYVGPRIDRESLLRYIVSFRQHNDYHEHCVERMFMDIRERCRPRALTVYARYQRRGGIDINPYRSDFEEAPKNLRLWRQ